MEKTISHQSDRMGAEAPLKLILRFALPAILTMVISSLYNTVDRIFVGQGIGYLGLSATTVSTSIMQLISGFTTLFGTGGAIFLALELGERRGENAEKILGSAVTLQCLVGIAVMVIGLAFVEPICRFAGAGEDAMPYTVAYLRIVFFGCIAQCVGTGMAAMIRSEGCPKQAMICTMTGAVLNCFLDPLFIFGFHWGIQGAAAATVVSEYVSAVMVIVFFVRSEKSEVKLKVKNLMPDRAMAKRMLVLGLPSLLMTIAMSIMILLFNKQLQHYGNLCDIGGDVAISALGVSVAIGNICAMVGIGMQQGVAPLIGYNYGAELYSRVRSIYRTAMILLLSVLIVFLIILEVFPVPLINLFGDAPNMEFAIFTTRVYNLALPLLAFQTLGGMYLQSTGQTKIAMVVSLARNVFFGIPLLLILPLFLGVHGAVWMGPAADTLGALVSGLLAHRGLRKLRNLPDRLPEEQV